MAIASRSREKLKEAVERFGFRKVYESYDRLLEDPEIDAVYIPLPNALHKEWAVKAARHGKHVLCEKPLALTAADCRELEAVFKEKRVRLMEAFMYRFLPGMKAVSYTHLMPGPTALPRWVCSRPTVRTWRSLRPLIWKMISIRWRWNISLLYTRHMASILQGRP